MAFFSQEPTASSSGLPPLSGERIAAWLRARSYNFDTDDDGDLYAGWGENLMWFLRFGQAREVLQIRGCYGHPIEQSRRAEILELINEWHCDRIWPKLYITEGDGAIRLFATVSVDLEAGVTDEQLFQFLDCGLNTAMGFFNQLDERFGYQQ